MSETKTKAVTTRLGRPICHIRLPSGYGSCYDDNLNDNFYCEIQSNLLMELSPPSFQEHNPNYQNFQHVNVHFFFSYGLGDPDAGGLAIGIGQGRYGLTVGNVRETWPNLPACS